MAYAAETADFDQSLDIKRYVAAQVAFHDEMMIDILSDLRFVAFGKVADADVRINAGYLTDVRGSLSADAIDIGKGNFNALISWQVYT